MSQVEVKAKVRIYEIDGEAITLLEMPTLAVVSHWNDRDRVKLIVGGKTYAVLARDLRAAIDAVQRGSM